MQDEPYLCQGLAQPNKPSYNPPNPEPSAAPAPEPAPAPVRKQPGLPKAPAPEMPRARAKEQQGHPPKSTKEQYDHPPKSTKEQQSHPPKLIKEQPSHSPHVTREQPDHPSKSYKEAAKEGLEEANGHATKPNGQPSHPNPGKMNEDENAARRAEGVKSGVANLSGDGVLETASGSNGNHLTSTRPPEGYETALQQDRIEETKAPKSDTTVAAKQELVSGRQAGQRWHTSPIHWAPLNVPLQRRLQTLAVLCHALSIAALLALFFVLAAIPLLWPILVPYLIYTLFSEASVSGELSHRSERFRRSSIWSLFASYFPARLHRSQVLQPTRKYLFGYHPHGIISHGAFAAFTTEALGFSQLFPGITNTLLTLDSNFRIPLYREYALAMGLASVSRESCENLLSKGGINGEGMGRGITIVVGGARESLDAEPHTLRLVLKRRKGFVKLAVRNGADLVPVLGFGENELYEQFRPEAHPRVHKFQLMVKRILGFTIPLFHARGVFNYDVGLLPYRQPVNVVVGRPILIEQKSKPDDEYISKIHEQYMGELQRLWEENKDRFAKERTSDLQIVE